MGKTVGIVILNYNGLTDTLQLLESIQEKVTSVSYSVIIVDNASDNDEAGRLEDACDDRATVLRSPKNCGYAAGNNIGLRYAVDKGFENLCILNNDTVVTDDFLRDSIEYLDSHPDVAIVSPAIIDQSGKIQSMGGTYSLIKGNAYFNCVGERYEDVVKEEKDCDMVFGACMVFKASLIDLIGYLPEAYFLFYEETEWCLKAQKAGKKCVCIATHCLIHKGSATINRLGGLSEYLYERNRVVFAKRNLNGFQFLCFLVFDFCRLLYQSARYHVPFRQYFRYHLDGLKGRVDPRFPFVWINENE